MTSNWDIFGQHVDLYLSKTCKKLTLRTHLHDSLQTSICSSSHLEDARRFAALQLCIFCVYTLASLYKIVDIYDGRAKQPQLHVASSLANCFIISYLSHLTMLCHSLVAWALSSWPGMQCLSCMMCCAVPRLPSGFLKLWIFHCQHMSSYALFVWSRQTSTSTEVWRSGQQDVVLLVFSFLNGRLICFWASPLRKRSTGPQVFKAAPGEAVFVLYGAWSWIQELNCAWVQRDMQLPRFTGKIVALAESDL